MPSSRARRRPAEPVRSSSRTPVLAASLIVAVGALVYWNSLTNPFVWDDQTAILTNRSIQHLWPLTGPLQPPRETPVAGRPIVNLSLAVNYAVGGLSEPGYHVWNIVVHLACALLLFGLVRRTLASGRAAGAGSATEATALGAALLWMVHPLQSEAVDYITQRTESMMALFFLLTLYCAVRARRAPRSSARAWETLAILACAAGMACKESMVTAPLVVVLYDRLFEFASMREAFKARKLLYTGLAATWIVLAVLILQRPRSTAGLSTSVDSWTYLLNQATMIARYLRLVLWPGPLVLDYGLPRSVTLSRVLPSVVLVLALIATTVVAFVRWPRIGFLAVVFFLTLAPTSSAIPISSEVGAERRMYLPFAALAVLVAAAAQALVDRVARTSKARSTLDASPGAAERAGSQRVHARPVRRVAAAAASIVLAALATRTVYRNAEYATAVSLWRTVVERWPHGRARMAYATELIGVGRHDEAMLQLREAIRDYPDAKFALGTELVAEGRLDEGIQHLREFVGAGPSNVNRIPARTLMGQALASQGKLAEAVDQFQAVLRLAPSNEGVRGNLAEVLMAQGRYEEAASELRSLLVARPDNASVETRLATALAASGHAGEAIAHLENAVRRQPQSAELNRSLAEAYLRQNDAGRGGTYAREAVRLSPNDPQAHNLLGIALASSGQVQDAIGEFRQALRLAPDNRQAQANLERALRAAGSR